MKRILKKEVIIAFIIGLILASSIAVYAYSYMASDIGYTKSGTETAISVENALNELYTMKENKYSKIKKQVIGTGNTNTSTYIEYDVTSIPNYQNLTTDNFSMENIQLLWIAAGNANGSEKNSGTSYNSDTNLISYNPLTGKVRVEGAYTGWSKNGWGFLGFTLVCRYME